MHDLSLNSGERQTAKVYREVRADHRFRYEWAAALIGPDTLGLDCFCGAGYGTWLLAQTRDVLGYDGSAEAIAFAQQHYATARARYQSAYWPFTLQANTYDFVVSLESIEHVKDGDGFFDALTAALKPGGLLIYSTPNEDRLSHVGMGNHFHHRHYTHHQAMALADRRGLELVDYAGQDTYRMEGRRPIGVLNPDAMKLKPRAPGQFTIIAVRKPT